MTCLTSARYHHKIDIYTQSKVQSDSGFVEREWEYDSTLPAAAQSIHTLSVTDQASGKKFRQQYREYDAILIFTSQQLSKRFQIRNITNADGSLWWDNDEGEGVIFEVQGCKPIVNGFGRTVEWETLAMRTEVQNADS